MLGEVFSFMNSCFPDQKLILKAGNVELGEKEIKAIEANETTLKKIVQEHESIALPPVLY